MIDLTGITHHPVINEITDVLCNKTQNTDRGFFQTEVAYFISKLASCMRATIVTKDRGDIPVNMYALALATSGFGKGHSVNIMEEHFIKGFKKRFMEDTLPVISEQNLWKMANDRALRNGSDQQEEFDSVQAEYKRYGAFPFTFDSGTVPAVKQLRSKLLLAGCGAINLQIDEIGSNLIGNVDMLNVYLELYDQGIVKGKLIKNTADNTRGEEIDGKTPANLLLFGTPAKLLDGSQTEDQFYQFLDTGYARRCLFGIGHHDRKAFHSQSAHEIYARLIQPTNNSAIVKWAAQFHKLADPSMFGWKMQVEDDVGIRLLEYKISCEKAADLLPEHEEIKKAELSHRYFKALKLSGAFAFIDEASEIEMEHLMSAILLVEESGSAFQTILNREKAYVKLAKYISTVGSEVTHADLLESLPYYPKSNSHRNEMIALATAWGYPRHIIIKKSYIDSIEFFKGETLTETNLDEIFVSYSESWAYDYLSEKVPFDQLHNLTQAQGLHWSNHHFRKGHRAEENVIAGFNMIVIDVDGGVSIDTVHDLMKEIKFMTYTTKRHSDEAHRFRLMIPINYELELDGEEFKEFMNNVMEWLPFRTDEAANQRSKKWETFDRGEYHYNLEGELFDALPFIPKTSKNEQYRQEFKKVESLDNLQRWFAGKISQGNRNNNMLKYAMALVDSGYTLMDVQSSVYSFNERLQTPLDKDEIASTIMVTVAKKYGRA
jgi:hypothetical protein